MVPTRIPFFRSSEASPDTNPTKVGPPEQPTSPASASNANNAVPPLRNVADALLKLPGHMIPTDNPQTEQPISDKKGDDESDMHKYDKMQRMLLPIMNLSKLILSPNLP